MYRQIFVLPKAPRSCNACQSLVVIALPATTLHKHLLCRFPTYMIEPLDIRKYIDSDSCSNQVCLPTFFVTSHRPLYGTETVLLTIRDRRARLETVVEMGCNHLFLCTTYAHIMAAPKQSSSHYRFAPVVEIMPFSYFSLSCARKLPRSFITQP